MDHVQITMSEDIGIGGRAGYYDGIGAARDVIQNHLLQLLALTAMEEPVSFDADSLRQEKEKILSAVRLPADLAAGTARGQYAAGWQGGRQVIGYLEEEGIPPDSRTETYAAVQLVVDTRRWAGVPFYLRTGKRLTRRMTEIALMFQRAPHLPFAATDTEELGQNALVIRVQPDEGVTVRFGSKVPGSRDGGPRRQHGLRLRRVLHRVLARGLRAADPRRAHRRPAAVPPPGGGRALLAHPRPDRELLGREHQAGAVRVGLGRARVRRRDDGARRPRLAPAVEGGIASMTIDLTDTTTGAISNALTEARRRLGGMTLGMVLTLIIVTDEEAQYDAIRAANQAAREHPCRVLAMITRKPKADSRLDAEIRVGEAAPGETIVLRMYGPLGQHADSVAAPLLVPDVPVVTWWPEDAPEIPAKHPLGALAQRRVTDSAAADLPQAVLATLARAYQPGDTDFGWTRATPWRSLLAATLDQPHPALQRRRGRGRGRTIPPRT